MPEWELRPFDNFPQTDELYLEQIEQELESLKQREVYLLSERERVEHENT